MAEARLVSVIVPVYNESANLKPFFEELVRALEPLSYRFEIAFVDDGSTDDSAAALLRLAEQDARIRIVQFSRNFGKEAAVSAGLHTAKGDAAIILDADLQMPPRLIGEFLRKWEAGAEVVVGLSSSRSRSFLRRIGAKVFYRVLQSISRTPIDPDATDYRLLDRQVIDTFNALPERNRLTRGLIDWLGFERASVPFEEEARRHGKPTYRLSDLFALALNGFTAFSLVPLRIAGVLGLLILSVSVPAGIFLFVVTHLLHDPFGWSMRGTAFLAIMILALVGLVLACLGLMSLYIARIHAEVLDRPLYVVRRKLRAGALPPPVPSEARESKTS